VAGEFGILIEDLHDLDFPVREPDPLARMVRLRWLRLRFVSRPRMAILDSPEQVAGVRSREIFADDPTIGVGLRVVVKGASRSGAVRAGARTFCGVGV